MDLPTGVLLGSYQIVKKIGQGQLGAVYKGLDTRSSQYVAIKVLNPRFVLDRAFVHRFLEEARQAAQLKHPHLVRVHETGQTPPLYYFVMDYVQGVPLSMLVQKWRPVPLTWIVPVIAPAGAALDYVHALGLVHQGVQSSNILIGERDQVTLTDFGLIRAVRSSSLDGGCFLLGSPTYLSPEQAQGRVAGQASDLYALGIVVYEMLAGQPPYGATPPLALLMQHVFEPLPPLSQYNPQVPPSVEQVLQKALEKDPRQRPGSASAFVTALNEAIQEHLSTLRQEVVRCPLRLRPGGIPGQFGAASWIAPSRRWARPADQAAQAPSPGGRPRLAPSASAETPSTERPAPIPARAAQTQGFSPREVAAALLCAPGPGPDDELLAGTPSFSPVDPSPEPQSCPTPAAKAAPAKVTEQETPVETSVPFPNRVLLGLLFLILLALLGLIPLLLRLF
ncbi:MAG: protein kinase [Chloroflexia bacterium]|nr:protein kinase [Chloroflexia bacterium]